VLVITAKDGMYTTSFRMKNKQKWWDNSRSRPHVWHLLGCTAPLTLYFAYIVFRLLTLASNLLNCSV
jgi:hypothetical protein